MSTRQWMSYMTQRVNIFRMYVPLTRSRYWFLVYGHRHCTSSSLQRLMWLEVKIKLCSIAMEEQRPSKTCTTRREEVIFWRSLEMILSWWFCSVCVLSSALMISSFVAVLSICLRFYNNKHTLFKAKLTSLNWNLHIHCSPILYITPPLPL